MLVLVHPLKTCRADPNSPKTPETYPFPIPQWKFLWLHARFHLGLLRKTLPFRSPTGGKSAPEFSPGHSSKPVFAGTCEDVAIFPPHLFRLNAGNGNPSRRPPKHDVRIKPPPLDHSPPLVRRGVFADDHARLCLGRDQGPVRFRPPIRLRRPERFARRRRRVQANLRLRRFRHSGRLESRRRPRRAHAAGARLAGFAGPRHGPTAARSAGGIARFHHHATVAFVGGCGHGQNAPDPSPRHREDGKRRAGVSDALTFDGGHPGGDGSQSGGDPGVFRSETAIRGRDARNCQFRANRGSRESAARRLRSLHHRAGGVAGGHRPQPAKRPAVFNPHRGNSVFRRAGLGLPPGFRKCDPAVGGRHRFGVDAGVARRARGNRST